jgi:glycosyltransferase involved in cell wall biosynthesis
MVNLACGLKQRGHAVELFVYFPDLRFFRKEIDLAGITVHEVRKRPGFSFDVLFRLIRLFRKGNYDAVVSFLDTPNMYCELAKLFSRYRGKLLVSERNSYLRDRNVWTAYLKRALHVLADRVVCNSHTQGDWLKCHWHLRKRVSVIYNGYPIGLTQPALPTADPGDTLKFLVVGRVTSQKNGLNLLKALIQYFDKYGSNPLVAWAGRQEHDPDSLRVRAEMDVLLAGHPAIAENWKWLGERDDIPELLKNCDALLHISLFEGLPNAVCESFIAGRPVIASNVCDHPILVEEGVRGILCAPRSPSSIFLAIERFSDLSVENRKIMGRKARVYAEAYLTLNRMVCEYEALLAPRSGTARVVLD